MKKVDVAIVGAGPAGISATIWCKRLEINHLLLESQPEVGGQLNDIHNQIVDYPGIIAENGKEMKRLFSEHLQLLNCNVETGAFVTKVEPTNKIVSYIKNDTTREVQYNYLIYSAGSSQRCLDVPGEEEMLKRGEVYSATRDRYRFSGKQIAVIGGGDRAFEGALLLAKQGAKVILIHRANQFRARRNYQEAVFAEPAITVWSNTVVQRICGDTRVEQVEVTKEGVKYFLDVDAVFIRIGVEPQTALIKDFIDTDSQGYIIVDKVGQTSIPSIFAIGDTCNTPSYSGITSSAGQGMVAVKRISEHLKIEQGTPYF